MSLKQFQDIYVHFIILATATVTPQLNQADTATGNHMPHIAIFLSIGVWPRELQAIIMDHGHYQFNLIWPFCFGGESMSAS